MTDRQKNKGKRHKSDNKEMNNKITQTTVGHVCYVDIMSCTHANL